MVLRPGAVRERLLRLEEVVSRLEELARFDPHEIRRSFRDAWAVERGLQLAAEIVFVDALSPGSSEGSRGSHR